MVPVQVSVESVRKRQIVVSVMQLSIAVTGIKDMIYYQQQQTRRNRGKTRFDHPAALENLDIYKKHFNAQKRVDKMNGAKWVQRNHQPDHLLDASVYAVANLLRKTGWRSLTWYDKASLEAAREADKE